ncbi:MAG: RDD family protein [Elusimicrobia bacterium]|nr:RDD family protein [Elusimicrobiota bacterium]
MTTLLLAAILSAGAWAAPEAPVRLGPIKIDAKISDRGGREIVRFGGSVTVKKGETAESVVVIGGSADVEGAVERDVVAIGGSIRVAGPVGGDVVAVGGQVKLREGASVAGDAVSIGGMLDQEEGATVKGDRHSIGLPISLPSLGWLKDWASDGLLMGRPLPHRAGWAWALAAAMLLVYVLVAAAFPAAVDRCAGVLAERPATALGVGALAIAMAGPAALLLVMSIIGIAAVPLAACAAGVGFFVGKAAVYRTVGARVAGLEGSERRVAAVITGAVLFTLLYAVPAAGFIAWGAALLFGFGAAVLAFADQFRGETGSTAQPAAAPVRAAVAVAPEPGSAGAAAVNVPVELLPRASFGLRLGAIAIDVFSFLVLVGLIPMIGVSIPAWAVYQIGLWTWKGTTLGGIVCGIKGVRLDGGPMDLRVAAVRHLASYLSLAPGFLGFLWAAWDPDQATWHDKIAGTAVVRVPKGEPLL